MKTRGLSALALGLALSGVFALAAEAQTPAPAAPAAAPAPPNDYTNPANWLCRPGREDACTVDLDATIVRADGTTKLDRFHADPKAPIDCFYVYPTVSRDPGVNATMKIEPAEKNVVRQQFARLAAVCRLYAPMYRQHTLTALVARMMGRPMAGGDPALPYRDVSAAFHEYLTHDNHGRGFVLVGHSQGSGVLTELIARQIDGKPLQKRLVSAILMGTSLQVPPGRDVGGDFKHIPLCHSASQTGCVIAFADFRADSPPPPGSFFGWANKAKGTVAACVNPAALGGGSGPLHAFLAAHDEQIVDSSSAQTAWTDPPTKIATPFVEVPGLLTGECVSNEHGNYLAVTLHPTPGGHRTNQIGGDVVVGGQVQKNWGLHLIDANLHMGELVKVVGEESKAYEARR